MNACDMAPRAGRVVIEIADFGWAPKFVSIGYFCGHLVTCILLIELEPMVPFPVP